MSENDLREQVNQLHTVIFGAESQGGLLREVSDMKQRLTVVEAKTTALTAKWVMLMTLVVVAAQFLTRWLMH